MLGTSGNLSVLTQTESLQFLITVSGKDKGELIEDDFILVDENGKSTHHMLPSAETLLHSAIYKHTNAKAVFHVHTTNSTLLSIKSKDNVSFSGLEMLKGLGFKTHEVDISIPVIENNQNMKYLSEIAPNYINENVPGLILRGHGIYAWGKSIEEAKKHVEIFEFLFEYRIKELSLNSIKS
jgi:methylthioribulose-1-phosphate dehydratase